MKVHSLLLEVRTGLPVPAAVSLAGSWFQASRGLGEVETGQSSGFPPASLGSDSKGMTPPLVGGVAAWSLTMQGCPWVADRPLALFQRGPGLWEIGGRTLGLTYCPILVGMAGGPEGCSWSQLWG